MRISPAIVLSIFSIFAGGGFRPFDPGVVLANPTAAKDEARVKTLRKAWERHRELALESKYRGLPWRCVGPVAQGGRLVDIESVPGEPYSFYIAYASGGIWKTTDNGQTFLPLFDDQPCTIIGDLAVDPSRKETLWVGTGENNSSRSSYGGMGIFRSRDGGETWELRGLEGTDRIGRVLVDPRDSNRVYVAALGKLYTEGGDRGIYRTTDGGESWSRLLAGGPRTGFVDLVFDPSDPDVLYAAGWERIRRPWEFVEGGLGSGIWKTTDGGESWTRLKGGFPSGEHVGRIGLAVSAANPSTVYALLDHQQILPESEWDLGASAVTPKRLRKMTREEFLSQDQDDVQEFLNRYNVDPELDAKALLKKVENGEVTLQDLLRSVMDGNNSLFESDIRGVEVWRSDDGGTEWRKTHEESLRDLAYTYGYYFGQIRVSPVDSEKIYVLGVPLLTSEDGGKTFHGRNAPNVHVDHQAMWIDPSFPDRIFLGNDGGLYLSHNGGDSWIGLNQIPVGQFYTVAVDHADPYHIYGGLQDNGVRKGPSTWREGDREWDRVGGGDGMYVQIDPRDNETVYLGYQFGNYARIDSDGGRVTVKPRTSLKEEALRFNWCTPIQLSPHSPDILYMGGNKLFRSLDRGETLLAISPDLTISKHRGNVPFATLTTVAESPCRFGLIWVGTDDGQVHVTQDGGETWREVSGALPELLWVTRVEPSRTDPKVCYVSFSGYREDDPRAFLYRTDDLGTSWMSISEGLPEEPINVVKEDPVVDRILYVGTDRGVYVSENAGQGGWSALSGGLPHVPVHDLLVHPRERELVVGTHGRSIWVLDVLPLQELDEEIRGEAVHLYPVSEISASRGWRRRPNPWWDREDQKAEERFVYWCRDGGEGRYRIRDEAGQVILEEELLAVPGINVFDWDYRVDAEAAMRAEKNRREKERAEEQADSDSDADASSDANLDADADSEKETEVLPKPGPFERGQALGHLPYISPGSYSLQIEFGTDAHERPLEIKAPSPVRARTTKKEDPRRTEVSRPVGGRRASLPEAPSEEPED